MKISIVLIGLVLCGCASQPTESTTDQPTESMSEVVDIHVFYEEPKIDYEILGRVDVTRRADHEMDVLVQILRRAEELGADGVIVHSILNKGTVAGLGDTFGTGGGGGFAVYQINATAISYAQ